MSDFTAPGVYVKEALTPTPVIVASSTTTAAFIGRTRRGPVYGITDSLIPQALTSVADFQRVYGGFHAIGATPNYLALAVRAYFDNGGTQLYVSRVAELPDPSTEPPETAESTVDTGVADASGRTGCAKSALVVANVDPSRRMDFVARFPGEASNATLVVTQVATPANQSTIDGAPLGSLLRLVPSSPTPPTPSVAPTPPIPATKRKAVPVPPTLAKRVTIGSVAGHIAQASQSAALADASYFVKAADGWRDGSNAALDPGVLSASIATGNGAALLTITVAITDGDGIGPTAFAGLGFDARHPQWLGAVLCAHPVNAADAAANLVEARIGRNLDAFAVRSGLFATGDSSTLTLQDGADGPPPTLAAYQRALGALEQLGDVSTVAAPDAAGFPSVLADVNAALVANAELPGALRMAVLDTVAGLSPAQAQSAKGTIDSSYAALYYPWVVVNDPTATTPASTTSTPTTPATIAIPPSGFVAGIFASHDRAAGVAKAPGSVALLGGVRLERVLTDPESATLNPNGINTLRSFVGHGLQVWGARTTSSDQEWQYISVRRYVSYLERSIDAGTQWTVSEPNGTPLWSKVATTISNFLFSEFKSGALQGSTPTQAFLVRCDASTMTQNDIDNGRLICLVGVAAMQPAQFVIVRIEKLTSTAA